MKTTCLIVALSGLATAREPIPGLPPQPRVLALEAVPGSPLPHAVLGSPAVGGVLGDVTIPTPEARELAEPIKWAFHEARGRFHDVVRSGPVGFFGVNATVLPKEISAHLLIPEDTGLLVEVVAKDSPAEKGGLQPNDVLAKLDDQILIDQRQFSVLVANKKEGDAVKVTYIRKGETHETSVVIGKREGGATAPAVGKAEADLLFKHTDGAPLRTFVRRFEMPGGGSGEVKVIEDAEVRGIAGVDAGATSLAPATEDLKKQLEEIRAMLEALQQKVK